MTPFQYYYAFFTLIIGLAVADVARGFGTLWQTRRHTRIGYQTPLLAVFLLLDMSRFWLALWAREEITALGSAAIASVLCITLPYVFATTVMFPADASGWKSLDDYYDTHSRPIFLALLATKIATYASDVLLFRWTLHLRDVPGIALVLVPFLILAVFRQRLVHRIGLVLLTVWSVAVFVALN